MALKEFWIFKGTSNFCNERVMNDECEFVKAKPEGFYDIVSTADTFEGGLHVIEYSAYQKAVAALQKVAGCDPADAAMYAVETLRELGEL